MTTYPDEYAWIPFYKELSNKLLAYKNNRQPLLDIVHQIFNEELQELHIKNLLEDNNGKSYDTDPFTIFALINRSIKIETKIAIVDALKQHLAIEVEAPKVFTGLPEMHYSHIRFFVFGEHPPEIPKLWELFEAAIRYADSPSAETRDNFKTSYDAAASAATKWMLPMGLFWIRPETFLSLDNNNKEFIQKFGITSREIRQINNADQYLAIIGDFNEYLKTHPDAPFKNFYEFSAYTYENREKTVKVKLCWYLSGKYAEQDKCQTFLETGTWDVNLDGSSSNITAEWYQNIIKQVKPIKEGDAVALFTRKSTKEPPLFDTHGKYLTIMQIYATGIVTKNNGDGSLQINWNRQFEQPKDWYYFVNPSLNVWEVRVGKNKENNDFMKDLLDFTFNNVPQDFEKYNQLYQQNHLKTHLIPYVEGPAAQTEKTHYSKNIILYGPPGTGKTYNTVNYAVAIIENRPIEEIQSEPFDEVKERYTAYKARKLIEFVTFHQSYGYEDFIEGIKPCVSSEGQITYNIEPGIFKNFCRYATPEDVPELPSEFNIWKVSLKHDKNPHFWSDCLSEGCIRIGYEEASSDNPNKGADIVSRFKTGIQIGDFIIGMNSQEENIVVGRVTGEYEFSNKFSDFKHYRKVNWLGFYDKKQFISEINDGVSFTLASVYSLNRIRGRFPEMLNNLIKDGSFPAASPSDNDAILNKMDKFQTDASKPHVFVIDEINRGNVSKIFGELITSIEDTKRIGEKEELLVTLPYSKEEFGVPSNIYILGTMNTADRSLARIDTALRRRFTFKELMPQSELLAEIPEIEGVGIKRMLDTMNERIEYLLSREHCIGHAYFIPLKASPTLETLKDIFQNKIIPLLQEYFYDDYSKIQLILGDSPDAAATNFIIRREPSERLFRSNSQNIDNQNLAEACYLFNEDAFTNPASYRKIYE